MQHKIAVIAGEGIGKAVMPDDWFAQLKAIESVLVNGPRTSDMGGTATTEASGKAIAMALAGS